ncbi:MAG TPA: hypothetical protein VFQ43_03625 [Nitrososphaera sp.]|nr:hypothetical protein [Nitrososphaera sp.]
MKRDGLDRHTSDRFYLSGSGIYLGFYLADLAIGAANLITHIKVKSYFVTHAD